MSRIVTCIVCIGLIAGCKKDEDTSPTPPTADTGTTATAGACADLGLIARAWQDGAPATPSLKALAGDFTLETATGPFVFSERWTGCDSYLFVRSNPANWDGEPMWERDHEAFIRKLPENTHVFFISDVSPGTKAELNTIEKGMNQAIRTLGPDKKAWWTDEDRLHYVQDDLGSLDGWVHDYLVSPGWGFAIDRFQTIRDIGSLADKERYNGSWFDGNLQAVANEAIYYNFESDRQEVLDAQANLEVVELWEDARVESGWYGPDAYFDVTIPAGTALSADSLTVEMDMTCDGAGEYGVCPAWDRITTLWMCDEPAEATNPHQNTACQPLVPSIPGTCAYDGVLDPLQACSLYTDCAATAATSTGTGATSTGTGTGTGTGAAGPTITCEGAVPVVPADTIACPCTSVTGESADAVRTCDSDGQGYGECPCSCSAEVARWITTYHREGRWTSDARHALPWFERGGHFRFRYGSLDPYLIDIDLRFHNESLGARPSQSVDLFKGGTFSPTYNDRYEPIEAMIPSSATKVELAVIVTGHGQEQPGNCAEFCDTEHHFAVNGTENLISFPYLTSQDPDYFCENMVDQGTVPNQYGTWFYSRSNWCPGKEVDPIYIDVTSQITKGQLNRFEYWGGRNGSGPNSPGASIDLSSYVVIHE